MYTIRLPNFEGPLDLLLYFIRRDELNIYDIPIARLTRDFLEYIRLMQAFDLELAGDFIVMASTLMQIKAMMLLPQPAKVEDSVENQTDPREALVRQLLLYRQFKEAASGLATTFETSRYSYYRTFFDTEQHHLQTNDALVNATLFDLVRAFRKALERSKKETETHVVQARSVTVEEKAELILKRVRTEHKLRFLSLADGQPRSHIVALFLAILDLVKRKEITVLQDAQDDDIQILQRDSKSDPAEFDADTDSETGDSADAHGDVRANAGAYAGAGSDELPESRPSNAEINGAGTTSAERPAKEDIRPPDMEHETVTVAPKRKRKPQADKSIPTDAL